MRRHIRTIITIILAGIWVNVSEFFRNQVLLKPYWVEHYRSLGLVFPSEPVNGLMWVVWGFLFAAAIFVMSRKFTLMQTTLLSWLVGFVLMWVVLWNLSVLPLGLLVYAVPLSMLEAFVASLICRWLSAARTA